jgi:hypothetical protein
VKKNRIRDEQPESYFRELGSQFFRLKYLRLFDADPGWKKIGSGMEKNRIRDGKHSDPGSVINIPDPQHCILNITSLIASHRTGNYGLYTETAGVVEPDPR